MVKGIRRRQAKRNPAVHLLWCGPGGDKITHAFEDIGIENVPVDSYLNIENPSDLPRLLKKISKY